VTTAKESKNLEDRVLVFMPTGRDASLVCATLKNSNISAEACADSDELKSEIENGRGRGIIS
jgi:hypothetical protein